MEKQAKAVERDEDGSDYSMDRLSQLPQVILQHILSCLSQKEAVQTSVLSKSWRYLWYTRPNIEFRQSCFNGNKETFRSVLEKTLQGYHDQKLCIQEFCVHIFGLHSESISLLEKWIPIVTLNKHLKTFNLYYSKKYFDMPSIVFKAESLQKLYLHRCRLSQNPLDEILFKHLQTLSLTQVCIADETFEKIMSSCHLIEYVVLHQCKGLRTIKVNKGHNLKHFDFCDHVDDPIIDIHVPTIETIKIEGVPNWYHQHKYFSHLKSLCLKYVRLSSWSFDMLSYNFPCLEELNLSYCIGFEELQLLSRSVKHLILALKGSIKVAIDAPNIVKFEYRGVMPRFISFTTTSSEWKSTIVVCDGNLYYDASSWCLKINEMLKALSQSEISVDVPNSPLRVLNACDGLYEPVGVEHMILRDFFWSISSHAPFLNCLFCFCRPKYVCAHTGWEKGYKELNKFLWKVLVTEREMRHYFWQRDLEEVSVEAFDDNGQEWRPLSLSECALPSNKQKIRFRLKWNELSYLA